jgi:plasmid stabilization system protein ParE
MKLRWTSAALRDLGRLHDFLAPVNPNAAANTTRALSAAPLRLLRNPRIGVRLFEYDAREVRRIIVGAYELRYELTADEIVILRLWHTREDR